MSNPHKAMALIGLGNPLMSDEGIGVRLVAEMGASQKIPAGVDVLDMGTSGMGVLHAIAGRGKVIFVDCALMGEEPGTMRRFTPEEVASQKVQTRLSLHEGDLLHTLALARRLGDCPAEIVILGVEPALVVPGLKISSCLESRLGEYLDLLTSELVPGQRMHELSICCGLVDASLEEYEALDPPAKRLKAVRAVVGGLHQIVPEFMVTAYELLTQDTLAAGSVLNIKIQPVIGCCKVCGWEGEIIPPFFQCADCEALAIDVLKGHELYLDCLEVEFDEH